MSFTIDGIDHLVVNVSDVEASAAWYERVLGMTRQDTPGTPVRTSIDFGRQKINLRAGIRCEGCSRGGTMRRHDLPVYGDRDLPGA